MSIHILPKLCTCPPDAKFHHTYCFLVRTRTPANSSQRSQHERASSDVVPVFLGILPTIPRLPRRTTGANPMKPGDHCQDYCKGNGGLMHDTGPIGLTAHLLQCTQCGIQRALLT